MTEQSLSHLLIGDAPGMRHLRTLILRLAPTDLPVLINGETGTGKELVAEALHTASGRKGQFVPINMCALADSMFESLLFGHVRGSFTGALANSLGFLAEADGGTVLLDEISGLSVSLQAKLLRAIETRRFRPIGAARDRESAFRVVAASNEDLNGLSARGTFRADLLHRLAGVTLRVPPLRERPEDIPTLARFFLQTCPNGGVEHVLTDGAKVLLSQYSWPGNVRQLKQVVERVAALASSRMISSGDVSGALVTGSTNLERSDPRLHALVDRLEKTSWDVAQVADDLGVHRSTVYRRLSRAGVPRPRGLMN
jgi:DNA-binding NtrC family response regulator